uniref:Uncharacterized protein n=1 Tax=Arcella intermedia TaxID=1963864 RepID=A0A6B2LTH6_9EUKA
MADDGVFGAESLEPLLQDGLLLDVQCCPVLAFQVVLLQGSPRQSDGSLPSGKGVVGPSLSIKGTTCGDIKDHSFH